MVKEYGGYLPLEMNSSIPYHNYDSKIMVKCNSGLTAIYCALMVLKPRRVYLPHYICPTVSELVSSMNIESKAFYITNKFEPLLDSKTVANDECVILVNYFGICDDIIDRYQCLYKNLIIDNTQSFFSKPVLRENAFNVYSCRKFIGTSDGGYCISISNKDIRLDMDYSSRRYLCLLEQIEYGTNYAYKKSLENYYEFKDKRRKMSVLTDLLLCSINYSTVIEKRNNNFNILDGILGKFNRLKFYNRTGVPYSYPLLIESGDLLRSFLISNKVYVATIWKENITNEYKGKAEYDFSANILHLPIDQRYNADDMKRLAEAVKKGLKSI